MITIENHFEKYIEKYEKINFHPELMDFFKNFPSSLESLTHLIFYGSKGSGKYTQLISTIQKFSISKMKYEKKIAIETIKQTYFIKMSDVHFEIDFGLLGCNSKQIWHDIYNQIVEIITSQPNKTGIIVCKNFHEISNELLEIFYSYLQKNNLSYSLYFILLTESISFIPSIILSCFKIIPISINSYLNEQKKNIYNSVELDNLSIELENYIINYKKINFVNIRNKLYQLLLFNHSIIDFVEKILSRFILNKHITFLQYEKILIYTYHFCFSYQNNYRPIFHLESYFYNLIKIIHEL